MISRQIPMKIRVKQSISGRGVTLWRDLMGGVTAGVARPHELSLACVSYLN